MVYSLRMPPLNADDGASILERVIDPEKANWSPDAAHSILSLDFGEADRDRMNQLAEAARSGDISAEEKQELENFLLVGHMVDLLHSKARQSLRRSDLAA